MDRTKYNQKISVTIKPILCPECDMEFSSEGLLSKHLNHSCLERPSQKSQQYQKHQQHLWKQQQQQPRFTDQAEAHLKRSSEFRERRHELEKNKQDVEAELRALERVRYKKEVTAKQNLARIAQQQNQNALALQQLRSVKDSQGRAVKLTEEDEEQLLEIIKMRQRCLGREGGNSEILHHIANLEKSVIEKAGKASQQQPKKETEENKDVIRQMARLEEENERLRKEFQRLQDLNRDFLQQQQTMLLQRNMFDLIEKRATHVVHPVSTTTWGPDGQHRVDLARHEEELEMMRLKLEEMERRMKEQQAVNNNNIAERSPSLKHTRSPNRSPVAPSAESMNKSPVLRGPVAPTSESPIPIQQEGFRLMFDYVRGLTRDVELAKLNFSLYSGSTDLHGGPTTIECKNPYPLGSGLEYIFKFGAKQPVPSCDIPELAVLLTLEVKYADGNKELVGWNKINLFEGFEHRVLNDGKWKISLRKPPVLPLSSKTERNAMRTKFTKVDVYIRLMRGWAQEDDLHEEDLPTDYASYNFLLA